MGPKVPVEYELPKEAVVETIVNAVAHRDYLSNAAVQVMVFADRLEVWNLAALWIKCGIVMKLTGDLC